MNRLQEVIAMADRIGMRALMTYGEDAQLSMVNEECGELITAIARNGRGRVNASDVLEECADVIFVALQAARIYGEAGDLEEALARKVERLKLRMESRLESAK